MDGKCLFIDLTLSYPSNFNWNGLCLSSRISLHLIESMVVQVQNQQRTPPLKWGKAISIWPATHETHPNFNYANHWNSVRLIPLNNWYAVLLINRTWKSMWGTQIYLIKYINLDLNASQIWSNHVDTWCYDKRAIFSLRGMDILMN